MHDGAVTRGVQFGRAEEGGLRNVGDPVELAVRYDEQGADEMVFFDITASAHGRDTMVDVMERVASRCFMPLTVGGASVRWMTWARCSRQALTRSASIKRASQAGVDSGGAEKFGSQCIVVSVMRKPVMVNGAFFSRRSKGGRAGCY